MFVHVGQEEVDSNPTPVIINIFFLLVSSFSQEVVGSNTSPPIICINLKFPFSSVFWSRGCGFESHTSHFFSSFHVVRSWVQSPLTLHVLNFFWIFQTSCVNAQTPSPSAGNLTTFSSLDLTTFIHSFCGIFAICLMRF